MLRLAGLVGLTTWLLVGLLLGESLQAEDRPLRSVIDAEVAAAWQRQGLTPAAPTTDAEFLRRVSLDLTGVTPSYAETTAFLADAAADKRERLIDRLLDDPRYAQHQADLWDLILFGRNPPGYGTDRRDGIQRWLQRQFAANRPYNELVRELLRAEGNSVEQGPPMYYVQYSNQPEDLNEVVTQTFLGIQLQCARCHDHPFDEWKQVDFYGVAAFFARLRVLEVGKKDNLTLYAIGEKDNGDILFTGPVKDQKPGQKGEPVRPRFLMGAELFEPALPDDYKEVKFENNKPPSPPGFSRKDQLADWITAGDNPYFARAIVNRIWAQYMGQGIVHPVDNLSPTNKPSHPELLDALAAWMVAHRFDLKALIREIVNTRTYQLSSAGETGDAMPVWFQHARTRPLSAEELSDSWRVATGYDVATKDSEEQKKHGRYHPLQRDYMMMFLGQPNNGVGDFQGGLAEHLYLNNGQIGSLISSAPGSLMAEVTVPEQAPEARVDRMFLQILNRAPHPDERERFVTLLAAQKDQQGLLRDAIWALLTCSEFRFNH